MKPTTALIIGAGALAILFIWTRSKGTALATAPKATSTQNLLAGLGGVVGGLGAGFLVSGPSSGSSSNTSSSIANQNTIDYGQASNYIADTTAASDTASGVVGFGGWDE